MVAHGGRDRAARHAARQLRWDAATTRGTTTNGTAAPSLCSLSPFFFHTG
ncbi:DUF560 domain-containing protein [Sesbania bispinosa]|nr:DUF560 domain-containing protein [Sesbania bispinosa]